MKKLYMMILLGLALLSLFGCKDSTPPDGLDTEKTTETTVPQDTSGEKDTTETTTAPETEHPSDPHLDNFRGVLGENDFCAVSYLGYLDGSYYEILAHAENLGVLDSFPFVEIPKENYIALEGGELYAVVPADPDAAVSVYSAVIDETNFTVKADRKLAEFTGGVPILLKCNVSEIMPNVVLQIAADGKAHTYSPSLSGENGQLVETEGVYDFSPYDVLFADIADGAVFVFCDKWLTTEPNRAGDPVVMCLNLLPDGNAEYACGLANSEFSELFSGTWSYDTEKDMIRLALKEVQIVDSDEPSALDRELRQLNCAFTWDMDDIYFKLTHVEGDELLDGLWGGTFLFLNEYDFHNVPKG